MDHGRTYVRQGVMGYASRLRFPKLFALTAVLFFINLVIPDPVLFLDEIVMGLVVLLLGSLRQRVRDRFRSVDERR